MPFALYALLMQMELVPIHAAPHEHKVDIKTQCCQILNDEWPRSETLRLRSLDSSRDDLPMCLALVQWFRKDLSISEQKMPCVLGHVRLARVTSKAHAVWIESVVIHRDLRGKGFGKYLMLIVEQFAREVKNFTEAYLCTIDKQLFYSRCGYSFSDPVCAYSGNVKLPPGLTFSKTETVFNINVQKESSDKEAPSENKSIEKFDNQENLKSCETRNSPPEKNDKLNCTSSSNSSCDNQLLPSTIPESLTINDEEVTDISVMCAKLFCRPICPSNPPEILEKPLRILDKKEGKKVTKDDICRAIIPKDYMKKKL